MWLWKDDAALQDVAAHPLTVRRHGDHRIEDVEFIVSVRSRASQT